jgi:NTP pyrophosphatase (non-canonical NTP hydrolase)
MPISANECRCLCCGEPLDIVGRCPKCEQKAFEESQCKKWEHEIKRLVEEAAKIRHVPDSGKPLGDLAKAINEWCDRKGWNQGLILGNMVANLHTEISEAWECIRAGHEPREIWYEDPDLHTVNVIPTKGFKPEGFPVELADLIIRVLHICAVYKIDIDKVLAEKMAYNETRSYRHGGKTA